MPAILHFAIVIIGVLLAFIASTTTSMWISITAFSIFLVGLVILTIWSW
jgi:hypothetical protein